MHARYGVEGAWHPDHSGDTVRRVADEARQQEQASCPPSLPPAERLSGSARVCACRASLDARLPFRVVAQSFWTCVWAAGPWVGVLGAFPG